MMTAKIKKSRKSTSHKPVPYLDWTRQQELKQCETVTGPGETSVERCKILSAEECEECGQEEQEKYLEAFGTIEERDGPGRA